MCETQNGNLPSSDLERIQRRRKRVRENVRAFRARERQKKQFRQEEERPLPASNDNHASNPRRFISPQQSFPPTPVSSRGSTPPYVESDDDILPYTRTLPPVTTLPGAADPLTVPKTHISGHSMSDVLRDLPSDAPTQLPPIDFPRANSLTVLSSALLKHMENDSEFFENNLNSPEFRLHLDHIRAELISGLRATLDRFMTTKAPSDATPLPLAISVYAATEALVHRSCSVYTQHLEGIVRLLEEIGPETVASSDIKDHIYGIRAYELWFALRHNRPSILARPAWRTIPWGPATLLSTDLMHSLLNVAFALAEEPDTDADADPDPDENADTQLTRLRAIEAQLETWRAAHATALEPLQSSYEPPFWPGLYRHPLQFADPAAAVAFVTYLGAKIHLLARTRRLIRSLLLLQNMRRLRLRPAPTGPLPSTSVLAAQNEEVERRLLETARTACRCLEGLYLLDGRWTARVSCLFPLDAAWGTFRALADDDHDEEEEEEEEGGCDAGGGGLIGGLLGAEGDFLGGEGEKGVEAPLERELRWCEGVAGQVEGSGWSVFARY